MTHLRRLCLTAGALSALLFVPSSGAQVLGSEEILYTTVFQNGSPGSSWTADVIWTNQFGQTKSNAVAGKIYEAMWDGTNFGGAGTTGNNTAIRTPKVTASPSLVFPGDSLILEPGTVLYLLSAANGAPQGGYTGTTGNPDSIVYGNPTNAFNGANGYPGLQLAGGSISCGSQSATAFVISGTINVAPDTTNYLVMTADGLGGVPNGNGSFFGLVLASTITNSGTIVILDGTNSNPQQVTALNNTFAGTWVVQAGWLQGMGDGLQDGYNSLGTNSSMVVDPFWPIPYSTAGNGSGLTNETANLIPTANSLLDLGFSMMNSAGTLILTNNGQMWLHGQYIFSAVTINGIVLTNGYYPYPTLAGMFPANFTGLPSSFLSFGGGLTVEPYTAAPPAYVYAPVFLNQPVSEVLYAGRTTQFSAPATGAASIAYQWYKVDNTGVLFTALTNVANKLTGATNATLNISNVAVGDETNFALVASVSNGFSSATSSVVTLSIIAPTSGYETNLLAAAPNNLVAYWRLNEQTDTSSGAAIAYDYWGGFNGVYGVGSADGVAGPQSPAFPGFESTNTALQTTVSVMDSSVTTPALNLNTNMLTIIAWINPQSVPVSANAIFFCRASPSGTTAGLDYNESGGTANLGFTWNNASPTYTWNTGIIPPLNQWSMVILTVSPTNASVSMINPSGLQTTNRAFTNAVQNFDGFSEIGNDSLGVNGARTFNGGIDEVAIFNTVLSPSQVASIYAQAAGISLLAPYIETQPASVTAYATRNAEFTVVAQGLGALSYQWAAGTTGSGGPYTNILEATNSSLALIDISTNQALDYIVKITNSSGSASSSPATLSIITPLANGYESGLIGIAPSNLIAYWRLNETNPPAPGPVTAFDYWGNFNGVYGLNTLNGATPIDGPQPGDGFLGFETNNTGLYPFYNNPNSFVTVPALNLTTSNVTMIAWIYPNSVQVNATGVVFCRAGTTTAGMSYNANGAPSGQTFLGYTWGGNSGTYQWNSGIYPPSSQWSMAALTLTPTNATVYLLNTSGFQSSNHVFGHPMEPFDGVTLIGSDSFSTTGSRTFQGDIDEVSVFNAALSQNQILSLYAHAAGISTGSPYIWTEPLSQTGYVGQTVEMSVFAQGAGALSYQWQAGITGSGGPYTNLTDGGQFSGSTNATLTIQNIKANNGLDYIVMVSNAAGSTNSTPATLSVMPAGPAQIIPVMAAVQESGEDWNSFDVWTDPMGTLNGQPAAELALAYPGSTFEVLPDTRICTPGGALATTFPGTALEVLGDGNFVATSTGATTGVLYYRGGPVTGVTGTGEIYFTNLVMSGGQVDIGNPGTLILDGLITMTDTNAPNSTFFEDNSLTDDRGITINSALTGSGNIQVDLDTAYATFQTTFSNNVNLTGSANTYTGTWNIGEGSLLGSGLNSLGTNSITIGATGALETLYNINSPSAGLTNNGQMFLHQSDTFQTLTVNGTNVYAGTYTAAQLNSLFPANFPLAWNQLNGSTYAAAAGSLTVLQPPSPQVTLQFTFSADSLQLTWPQGSLLQATNLLGPWVTNAAAVSPYSITPSNSQMFFKVVNAAP